MFRDEGGVGVAVLESEQSRFDVTFSRFVEIQFESIVQWPASGRYLSIHSESELHWRVLVGLICKDLDHEIRNITLPDKKSASFSFCGMLRVLLK